MTAHKAVVQAPWRKVFDFSETGVCNMRSSRAQSQKRIKTKHDLFRMRGNKKACSLCLHSSVLLSLCFCLARWHLAIAVTSFTSSNYQRLTHYINTVRNSVITNQTVWYHVITRDIHVSISCNGETALRRRLALTNWFELGISSPYTT